MFPETIAQYKHIALNIKLWRKDVGLYLLFALAVLNMVETILSREKRILREAPVSASEVHLIFGSA